MPLGLPSRGSERLGVRRQRWIDRLRRFGFGGSEGAGTEEDFQST